MPWRATQALPFGSRFWNANIYDGDEHIASAHGETREEADERARVITASQEMREVLEAVERIFDHGTDNTTIDEWDQAYGRVQNVLARLRGEEGS